MKIEKMEYFAVYQDTYVALATNAPADMLFSVLHYRVLGRVEVRLDGNSVTMTEKDAEALANWLLHSMKEQRPR